MKFPAGTDSGLEDDRGGNRTVIGEVRRELIAVLDVLQGCGRRGRPLVRHLSALGNDLISDYAVLS